MLCARRKTQYRPSGEHEPAAEFKAEDVVVFAKLTSMYRCQASGQNVNVPKPVRSELYVTR